MVLIDSMGIRGAGAVMRRYCSPRSWQRYMRELKAPFSARSNDGNVLKLVDEALSRFEPLRLKCFSSPAGPINWA